MNAPAFTLQERGDGPDPRALPNNIEAEQLVLGVVLYDDTAFERVDGLTPDSFYEPVHARIWGAIEARARKGRRVDPITIADDLKNDAGLKQFGGIVYLAELLEKAPSTEAALDYVHLIIDAHARRRAVELAQAISRRAMAGEGDVSALLSEAEASFSDLSRGAVAPEAAFVSASEAAQARIDAMADAVANGTPRGARTGLRCFDRRMGGLQPEWLVTIGGRPSMGKSALMRAAAFGCARLNPDKEVVIFSMEMSKDELIDRALSELSDDDGAGIPFFLMSQNKVGAMDLHRLSRLQDGIPDNLIIDDTPALGLDEIRRRTWAIRRKRPIAGVFVDYLQKMPLRMGSGRNDAALYGEITSGLHQLARQAKTCVVLLSQLNRMVEHRENKRPALADLRESGSIEADSNAVFFPYREAYYLERSEPAEGSVEHRKWEEQLELVKRRLEVICAKTRQGPIGTDVQVYFAEFDKIRD